MRTAHVRSHARRPVREVHAHLRAQLSTRVHLQTSTITARAVVSEKTKDHQELVKEPLRMDNDEEHDTMHSDGDGAQSGEEKVYTSGEDGHTCDQELYSDGTIRVALV